MWHCHHQQPSICITFPRWKTATSIPRGLQAKGSNQVPQSLMQLASYYLVLHKGHLPCSRTPKTVTVASRSTWFLMVLPAAQDPRQVRWARPLSSSPTTARSTTEPPRHVFPPARVNSPHAAPLPRAASHRRTPAPRTRLLLSDPTAADLHAHTEKFLRWRL